MHRRNERRFSAANCTNIDRFTDRYAHETICGVWTFLRQENWNVQLRCARGHQSRKEKLSINHIQVPPTVSAGNYFLFIDDNTAKWRIYLLTKFIQSLDNVDSITWQNAIT